MPYTPVRTVSGMNTVAISVNTFITWLRRFDVFERYASSSPVTQAHEVVVDIAEAISERLGDRLKLVGREVVCGRAEVDAVEDQVEVAFVALDLGMMHGRKRVLDRELVEGEDLAEHACFVGRRIREVDPDLEAATLTELSAIDRRLHA